MHQAIGEVFKDSDIHGCQMHYKMANFRAIQKHGLQSRYQNDKSFALEIKSLWCLAFVPLEDAHSLYKQMIGKGIFIDQNGPLYRNIQDYREYFERTWIGSRSKASRYDISLWNIYKLVLEDIPRTNNCLEGWHNGLRSCLRKSPNCLEFINFLKGQSILTNQKLMEYEESGLRRKQSATTIRNTKSLKLLVHKYEKFSDKCQYLKRIAKYFSE